MLKHLDILESKTEFMIETQKTTLAFISFFGQSQILSSISKATLK